MKFKNNIENWQEILLLLKQQTIKYLKQLRHD